MLHATCHAPGGSACYFPPQTKQKIHLCVILGLSSFQVLDEWKLHGTASTRWFGVFFPPLPRAAPCHFILQDPQDYITPNRVCRSFLFCIVLYVTTARYILCILCMSYEPCKSKQRPKTLTLFHAFKSPANSPFFPSPPHTAFKYLLQVLESARYDQECRRPPKRNAKTKPRERQERTSLCVPRSVRAASSEPGGQLRLRFLCDFQPQNFTINSGSHVEGKCPSLSPLM